MHCVRGHAPGGATVIRANRRVVLDLISVLNSSNWRRVGTLLLAVLFANSYVHSQTATTTTLVMSPSTSPVPARAAVTLTATVSAGATPIHPGQVTFCDTTAAICPNRAIRGTAQLTSAGTAVLRLVPGGGSHNFKAFFAGTPGGTPPYSPSSSPPQALTVLAPAPPVPSGTTISSSGAEGNYTLTATVAGFASIPLTGNVSFFDTTNSNLLLGTAPLGASTSTAGFTYGPTSPIDLGGNFPFFVATGDFNGDGIQDLAVQRGDGSVNVLLGDGSGGFNPASGPPLSTGAGKAYVALGDFNGDGILDLALSSQDTDDVRIFLGDGTGHFSAFSGSVIPTGGTHPTGVRAGDFNGDGIADLAIANQYTNNVSILLGDGTGHFAPASGPPEAVGNSPYNLAVGDFNGDGRQDLAVAGADSNNVTILLGDGTGHFASAPGSPLVVGSYPTGVAVGDFNGDGIADLAVANANSNTVSVLQGDGLGGFSDFPGSPFATGGSFPANVVVADFNGNGNADVALENNNSNTVTILQGNGSGGFTGYPGSPFATGDDPQQLAVGNFDGLGPAELAVVNGNGGDVTILLNVVTEKATATLTGVRVIGSGTHNVHAIYAGDTNFDSSTSPTIPLIGTQVATTTTLALSTANTIPFGTPVTLTASASPYTDDGLTTTGTVTFEDGTMVLGTAAISVTGEASITVSAFAGGTHTLTALYAGDGNFSGSTSASVSLTVNPAPIAVALASSLNPSNYHQPVTFTATVGSPIASGTIQFMNGTADLGAPVVIVAGVATLAISALTPGEHSITAVYSGDVSHLPGSSDALNQQVIALPTTTTLAVSPSSSPLAPQTVVTLTATVVSGGAAVSPGLVRFCNAAAAHCTDLALLGTAQLTSAGTAVLRFVPGSGVHSYEAVFPGTTGYTGSNSAPEAVTISVPIPFPTTTSIASSGGAGNYTLTATVVGTGSATSAPTGNISFVDTTNSNSVLGPATLGTATLARNFVNGPGSPVSVGSSPLFLATGDFNGDGIADIAVVNSDTNSVTILLGNITGGFAPTPGSPIPVGTTPFGVAVGDFNGDGHADLAVANSVSNDVSILLGDGSGGFTPVTPVSVGRAGSLPYDVAVGDFNSDGIADLVVADQGANTVIILLGNGSGGFTETPGSPVAVGSDPYSVTVADFNGDGIADLAVVNTVSNNVTILLGDGTGDFRNAPGSPVTVGGSPRFAAVGDFNGDGNADLAVSDSGPDTLSILLGDGHGGFANAPGSPIAVGNSPRVVVADDFNGDGIMDLAVANFITNDVSLLLGDGHGGFTNAPGSPVAAGAGPRGMVAADFNGDGLADLAVANNNATTMNVLLNQVTQTATATLSGVTIPGGATHQVNASYPGDTNFSSSTSPTIPLAGSPVPTATSLALSAYTIAFGTPVVLTANVIPPTAHGLVVTGTVNFYDAGTPLGSQPISATGEASLVLSMFAVGAHGLTAVYSGDVNFITSTSAPATLTVNPAPIALSLVTSDNPSLFGEPVTFTATVSAGATGTIQFTNDGVSLGGPVVIAGGVATYTINALTAGSHAITAVYSGDPNHLPATSAVLTQQVSLLTTTTTLTVSPSSSPSAPLSPQTVVTLTATVTTDSATVSPGLVRFCDATAERCTGLAVVGTAQLTNGTAVVRFAPGSGAHSYIAVFAGTGTHTTSTSSAQAVTVSSPTTFPTTTAIASSGSAGNYTLTATVVGIGNGTPGPTGSLSFVDTTNGNSVLGTAALGAATLARGFANALGSPVTVGHFPVAVAVGDFNGDGIADLVVANDTDNTLTILLGDGDGGFAPASGSPIAVGPNPFGVVVGDFNGDGIADLAVANSGSTNVSILLGNGSGGFSPAPGSPVTVGNSPYAVAIADFNGDGIADLAVADWGSNDVTILLGNGSGGFSALGSPVATGGTRPYAITVGDFNGDGITDMAVANQTSANVSILLGNGSGGFSAAPGSPITAGNHPQSVAVGDFNGDGIADLAVTNYLSNDMNIFLGDGHGGFSAASGSPVGTGAGPNYVAVGEFNGDGTADLVVVDLDANAVSIFLGDGHGGFSSAPGSPLAVGSLPYAVAVADFNGDGAVDLAVPNYGSNNMSILLSRVTQTATALLPGVSVPGSGTHNVNATYPGDTIFESSTSTTIPLIGSPVSTTTSLVLSTADTIGFGTPVTLTANVTPYLAGSLPATGSIAFHDGATVLESVPISATGEASITVPAFAGGLHTLTAVYAGDTNFITSTSPSVTLTVNPAPIAVSLISSDNPSGYAENVTFTATVPSGATGTIQFRAGAANLGSPVTIAGEVAAFATRALTPGAHPITAAYSGDGSHAAATSAVLNQLVTPGVLTVAANNSTRAFNQPNETLGYTITGFVGSDTPANSVSGAPTVVTPATQTSSVGSYPIEIGLGSLTSSNYTFVFMNGLLSVTRATPGSGGTVAITLASSVNPSSRANTVIFTATTPAHATGQVTFLDGTATLGTATIVADAASFSTSQLAVGTHPIMAVYGGDTNYAGATSAALPQVVNKTILQVIANDAQRVFDQPNPEFTTTITGFVGGDTPAVVTGAASVSSTATPASSPGVYPIVATHGTLATANYTFVFLNGDLTVIPATPGAGPTPPVTLDPSLNPAPFGSPVTFTVTVPTGATGTVSFYDGTTLLGTATIIGNTASLTISTLGLGTHTITAVYSGDANFTPTTTTLAEVVISAADFTVASSTGRQLIPPGASANFAIVVSSMNEAFTNSVTMSATNLPPGATYTFNPAAVTPGTAGASTTFTVSVPSQSSMASRRRVGAVAYALLLLPFAWLKRHRRGRQRLLFLMLVALVFFGAVSGCGDGGYFSQTEQTYTMTVTGTSGNVVHSTTVTLTVE